jgi:hypothetical protein
MRNRRSICGDASFTPLQIFFMAALPLVPHVKWQVHKCACGRYWPAILFCPNGVRSEYSVVKSDPVVTGHIFGPLYGVNYSNRFSVDAIG